MRRNDEGYATAEAAVALPALLVVLALAVGVVVTVGAQLRCVDAARAGARVAARGDSDTDVSRTSRQVAPGARISVSHSGEHVRVTVTATVRPTRWLPSITVRAHADAEAEPR
jgi:Flp pilus assembly protein TadG